MAQTRSTITPIFALLLTASLSLSVARADPLPDPDGKSADMSKPVQVFILMGQSNMVGFGKITGGAGSIEHAVKEKGLYPYLVDDLGGWTERRDVRNVFSMGSGAGAGKLLLNQWLSIEGNKRIGPEQGIGHALGSAIEAPVLILKSCIGNRALGWDLLPPGSERYELEEKGKTMVHAGYKEFGIWEKGTEPPRTGWYAGIQYDGDTANAKKVLAGLDKYYPGARGYEVAGFFWWQGDKDRYRPYWADRYEQNLVRLIEALRKDFDAPNAKFVCATLGQAKKGAAGNDGTILQAQLAVDGDGGKYPRFKGNVATVYAHPLSRGGASNSHYGGNAETYMNVGEAMGREMVRLLQFQATPPAEEAPSTDGKPLNTVCPVSGRPVDETQVVILRGKPVGFCCEKCKAKFEKDPKSYIAKIRFAR